MAEVLVLLWNKEVGRRGSQWREFRRRPAALLRPWRRKEGTRREWVGPGGAREGERAKGVERGLGVALNS